jgi:hypothetical protein
MAIDAKPPIHSSPSPYNEENNSYEVLNEISVPQDLFVERMS